MHRGWRLTSKGEAKEGALKLTEQGCSATGVTSSLPVSLLVTCVGRQVYLGHQGLAAWQVPHQPMHAPPSWCCCLFGNRCLAGYAQAAAADTSHMSGSRCENCKRCTAT